MDHRTVPDARRAWSATLTSADGAAAFQLRSVRAWGTLVGAKAWLASSSATP